MKKRIDNLSDKDIVLYEFVYALCLLGRQQRCVHMEGIALKCHQFAPSKFSWSKCHDSQIASRLLYKKERFLNSGI